MPSPRQKRKAAQGRFAVRRLGQDPSTGRDNSVSAEHGPARMTDGNRFRLCSGKPHDVKAWQFTGARRFVDIRRIDEIGDHADP